LHWAARCSPQLKEMKIAKNSVQIPANIRDGGKIDVFDKKLDKSIMHQILGVLTLPMRDPQRAVHQPRVVFQEHLLLGFVIAAARVPVRNRRLDIQDAHLQYKLLLEPPIPLKSKNYLRGTRRQYTGNDQMVRHSDLTALPELSLKPL
jgi:hypothetical protein